MANDKISVLGTGISGNNEKTIGISSKMSRALLKNKLIKYRTNAELIT